METSGSVCWVARNAAIGVGELDAVLADELKGRSVHVFEAQQLEGVATLGGGVIHSWWKCLCMYLGSVNRTRHCVLSIPTQCVCWCGLSVPCGDIRFSLLGGKECCSRSRGAECGIGG